VRVRQLILLVAAPGFVSAAVGCNLFHKDRAVAVTVVDAETKAPVAGASVRLAGPAGHDAEPVSGTTGADGVARLKAHPPEGLAIVLDATADGYMPGERVIPTAAIKSPPAGGEVRAAEFTVELFAGPRPTVELVLPAGYRGLVKVVAEVRDDVQLPPGQRVFRFEVPASGVVTFTAPPVFHHESGPEYTARYADGTPLNKAAKDTEVGFRWLTKEGDTQFFVVGTRADHEEQRKAMHLDSQSGKRSGGGDGGQQQGRRGGRGGRGGGGRGGM
jgi:hypothetical protein